VLPTDEIRDILDSLGCTIARPPNPARVMALPAAPRGSLLEASASEDTP
jgi:hypothetical protein